MGSLQSMLTGESKAILARSELELKLGSQQHVLRYWEELNALEQQNLSRQISNIHIADSVKYLVDSAHCEVIGELEAIAEERYAVKKNLADSTLSSYYHKGLEAISRNNVGVIVLAGGQGSRLGTDHPKGTLSLGIHESFTDSLLSIQAARIAKLQSLAKAAFPDSNPIIQWLVMTSESTESDTKEHLSKILPENGILMNQVTVFKQAEIPCFDMDENILLASKSKIATAPDGNGGLYSALVQHLDLLRSRGVRFLYVYCVDNVLCRVADPHFIGFCIEKEADCATKVVEKEDPNEAVGVVCLDGGKVKVVEYSEISKKYAEHRDPDGRLTFRAGSIANHYFSIDFLEKVCNKDCRLPFHRVHKKISFINSDGKLVKPTQPNGIKLEQFVFDVFKYSGNFHLWEVERGDEFSPLKNADVFGKDCPSTCRRDLSAEHRRWLEEAGAIIKGDGDVFIHPKRSYAGEGLEKLRDAVINTPVYLF